MPKETKPKIPEKADDEEQSETFIKAAQEAKTNNDPEAFEKAFRIVSKAPKQAEGRSRPLGKKNVK
jgi:vacuolar-type H+-ATPase subunit H